MTTACHVIPVQNTAMQAECTSTNGMADGYMISAGPLSIAVFGLLTEVRRSLAHCSASLDTGCSENRTRHSRYIHLPRSGSCPSAETCASPLNRLRSHHPGGDPLVPSKSRMRSPPGFSIAIRQLLEALDGREE